MLKLTTLTLLGLALAACGGEGATDPSTPSVRRDAGGGTASGDAGTAPVDAGPARTCHAQASLIGGRCVCNSGYEGDGTNCRDVDECAGNHGCPADSTCGNEPGSYSCYCDSGFEPAGNTCVAIQCAPCTADSRCAGGRQCLQRFCDGRFACYEPSGLCGEIGGTACAASSAWAPCSTTADCPAEFYPGGYATLRFVCHAFDAPQARCWPVMQTSHGQVEPPAATEPVECPPAPRDTQGLMVTTRGGGNGYEWEPISESAAHAPTYATCHLGCDAGDTCPMGMRCAAGVCK